MYCNYYSCFRINFFSISSKFSPNDLSSISAKTGLAPASITALATDMNDNDDTITSPEVTLTISDPIVSVPPINNIDLLL